MVQNLSCTVTKGDLDLTPNRPPRYDLVLLDKPPHVDYLVITPRAPGDGRPVIVFWDMDDSKIDTFADQLRLFLNTFQPPSVMFVGPSGLYMATPIVSALKNYYAYRAF